jgi:hypothetical protein
MSKADLSYARGRFLESFYSSGFRHMEKKGRPTIPPNSALIFDIKLHAIMQSSDAK